MQWHVNCNYIATGSSDKTVRLWDVQSGECVRVFIGHRSMILSLAMSPDGRYMASGDEDGTIMMWDLSSGCCVTPLVGHTSCVWSLAFRWSLQTTPLKTFQLDHRKEIKGIQGCYQLNITAVLYCWMCQLWRFSSSIWIRRLHSQILGCNYGYKGSKEWRKVSSLSYMKTYDYLVRNCLFEEC